VGEDVMRFYVFLMVLLLSGSACADVVALQFSNIKVPDLIDALIKNVVKRDYVMAHDVKNIGNTISINIAAIERGQVVAFLSQALQSEKVQLSDSGGILYFTKGTESSKPAELLAARSSDPRPVPEAAEEGGERPPIVKDELEILAYEPRYRTPEYLLSLLKAAGAKVEEKHEAKRYHVVLTDRKERLVRYLTLLESVDRPVASLFVKAAILEVTKGSEDNQSLGAVLSVLKGRLGFSITPAQQYSHALSLAGATIEAVFSAVQGDSRFKYLAEPQLKVMDGEIARVVVGADVPVKGQTIISNGQSLQGVEYRTTGVMIELEPRIMKEAILLRLKQTISDVAVTTSSGIDSPTMQKRESLTTLTAHDGELILVAGMDINREQHSESGLSFLPALFKSRAQSGHSSQMILMLEVRKLESI
jgi:type II secretory pathway component GspD/PulD (secretin)